jgi:hypothetical protein
VLRNSLVGFPYHSAAKQKWKALWLASSISKSTLSSDMGAWGFYTCIYSLLGARLSFSFIEYFLLSLLSKASRAIRMCSCLKNEAWHHLMWARPSPVHNFFKKTKGDRSWLEEEDLLFSDEMFVGFMLSMGPRNGLDTRLCGQDWVEFPNIKTPATLSHDWEEACCSQIRQPLRMDRPKRCNLPVTFQNHTPLVNDAWSFGEYSRFDWIPYFLSLSTQHFFNTQIERRCI